MAATATGPRVSVLIVSYNTRALLLEAIQSVSELPGVEVIVVDNVSSDGSADAVAKAFPLVTLVRNTENVGFARGVDEAAEHARGDLLLLLNPDAALEPAGLETLATWLEAHPRAAAVGARLVYGDGSPQDSAFHFPGLAQLVLDLFPVPRLAQTRLNGRYPLATAPHEVDHPLGACMLIRRAAWDEVGPLDPRYFMYVEEVDWCRRAKARGWQIWHHPGVVARHHAGQSAKQQSDRMYVELWRSRLRYYARFYGTAYNALVHLIVRLGMRAEARRARRSLGGAVLQGRLAALRQVRALAS
jgi:GT2 family glycosyltransferase